MPSENPIFPRLTLKPTALKRVSRGHAWIFSNEIKSVEPGAVAGGEVAVVAPDGTFFGSALYAPNALIIARIYSRRSIAFDESYLRERLLMASAFRDLYHSRKNPRRLVYSESDGLPGLIIDHYGEVLSVQILTEGIANRRELIFDILEEFKQPAAIVVRTDVPNSEVPPEVGLARGTMPESLVVDCDEISMSVDVLSGQKTGLFLDQADNWKMVRRFAENRSVLDLFCHNGGWTLNALKAGASRVVSVDSSAPALKALRANLARNEFDAERCKPVESDVFAFIREAADRFDVVVCDPPAFAKNKKAVPGALRGYREVNRQGMKRLAAGGVYIACSCSQNISREDFMETLRLSARDANRAFRVLPFGASGADHAPLLAVPETDYLKVVVLADNS